MTRPTVRSLLCSVEHELRVPGSLSTPYLRLEAYEGMQAATEALIDNRAATRDQQRELEFASACFATCAAVERLQIALVEADGKAGV